MNTINIMHVYFLAIGGAGIGPLAQLAQEAGYTVSGSDQLETSYIIYLREHGITDIDVGDSVDLIRNAHEKNPIDWLVYSSAVEIDEKGSRQLEKAKSLGIKCTKRDLFILELINKTNLKMIAIAGTHGKTTTTAMVSWLFINLNKPISYLIPAKVSFGEMAHYDKDSEYFIYEADEYDRNFLAFKPHLSIISGVSWDHHEIYKTREEYIEAFRDFINQSKQTIIWDNDAVYLGVNNSNLLIEPDNTPDLNKLSLKGQFNRRDGLLAVRVVSSIFNLPIDKLMTVINNFPGLSRRMEEISPNLFSDYAHTPDKVRGAISAASEIAKDRGRSLIAIYEPLTNKRQKYILDEYKDCFKGVDHLYWLPSYLAREDPNDEIIEPKTLIARLSDPSIAEAASRDQVLLTKIKDHLDKGDMVVALAGGGGGSLDDWLRDNFN